MKKSFRFFAAAFVLAAAASCAKEALVAPEAPAALQEKTFSATIVNPGDSKAAIEDNDMFKFTAGDYIIVLNNSTSSNVNFSKTSFTDEGGKSIVKDATVTDRIVAERIQITDEMLADGGRGLNFSTVVSDFVAPADCYHFLYLSSDAYADFYNTSSRSDNNVNYAAATTLYRKQNSAYTAGTRKVFCYARSDSKSGYLKFYHFDSQFKFKVSDTENYDKVTIEANGVAGAANSINPDIVFYPGRVKDLTKEFSGTNLTYNPNNVGTGTHPTWNKGAYGYTHNSTATELVGSSSISVTLSGDASSVYYVAVPALYTYENGVTFKLWKSGAVAKTLTAGSAITTAAAGIVNFGDIAKLQKNTYTSYYEMWQDGKSFKVGESTIDPKAAPYSSLTPVLIESSCNISSIPNWTTTNYVYFIKKGATLTIDSAKYWNDDAHTLWIIGDEIGTRSDVVWSQRLAPRGGAVALKNINITSSIDNSIDSEGKLSSYFIIDGCRIVLPTNDYREFARATNGASSGWNNIEIVNNDFIYTSGVASYLIRTCPTAAYTFNSIVVKNNQSYTSDGSLAGEQSALVWDRWQMRVSFQNADVENNTFVNCAYSYNVIYCSEQGVPVGGTLTVKNNINYVDGAATGYAKFFLLAGNKADGVTIDASNNYAWATADVDKLQSWGNVSCTAFSADPFESKNFTTGTFVLTSAAAAQASGCGAQR